MIYLAAARLVILAQPKTGSVALENALLPHSSWMIRRPNRMKHISYGQFREKLAPLLAEFGDLSRGDYEVVGVMREPLDWFSSMFRYNSREALKSDPARSQYYLGDVSFEDYIRTICRPNGDRPAYARVGVPCGALLDTDRTIGVDRIFPYEDMSGLFELIADRTGKALEPKRVNVSPHRELDLSDEARGAFRAIYKTVLDLHASLRRDGAVDGRFRSVEMKPDWL